MVYFQSTAVGILEKSSNCALTSRLGHGPAWAPPPPPPHQSRAIRRSFNPNVHRTTEGHAVSLPRGRRFGPVLSPSPDRCPAATCSAVRARRGEMLLCPRLCCGRSHKPLRLEKADSCARQAHMCRLHLLHHYGGALAVCRKTHLFSP